MPNKHVRRIYPNSCVGKLRHESEGAANANLKDIQKRWPDRSFTTYRCVLCNGWHVGGTERTGRR